MTKREFIYALMEDHNLLKEDASKIYDIVVEQIRKQLIKGNEVRLDDEGRFGFKYRGAGVINNNLLGKRHEVGPRVKLKFKIFPSMQRALNVLLAEEMSDV